MFTIQKIQSPTQKSLIVRTVLEDLPEWFGIAESTQNYIDEARDLPLWEANTAGETAGFITLRETGRATMEIRCMGIKKALHRKGMGRALVEAAIKDIRGPYLLLQVKTVAQGHYSEYDQTNAFYKALGFLEFEVLPELWDPWNPCQILVKIIDPGETT